MSNLYTARQGFACALVTRPYANEHSTIRVEGSPSQRLLDAERIAAMLNGEADPEIARLRQVITDTNNVLFDGLHDDIEHVIQCHAEDLPDTAKKLAKAIQEAMNLVSPVVTDLVGG